MVGGVGGTVYWGRKRGAGGEGEKGIAVVFAWASVHDKQLKSFIDLYSSLGWNSLVSHANFLTAFHPERVLSLAFILLNELVEELRVKPCPVVFVAFSGGPKACMYKVLQIIYGVCHSHLNQGESQLVRSCLSGHIYDSSPLDFTSDLCVRFGLHPAIKKFPGSSQVVSWAAKGIALGLDGLYLTRFESQRAEYWQTLYSSIDLAAPYLFLCSENDDLAPYRTIHKFARHLQDLGGDVELIRWNGSPHIGHFRYNPIQYRSAVTNLLEKAMSVFSQRIRLLGEGTGMNSNLDDISELICNLQSAAVTSNESLGRVAVGPGDHFFVSSSAGNSKDSEPLQEEWKQKSVCLGSPPSMNAHSVLGQMLFDVCVPKNVEGWDIRFSRTLNGQPIASARRHSPFPGIKCTRRSRL